MYKLRATNLQNVAPGNTATLSLACGANAPTLDILRFALSGGMTQAHIRRITAKANGTIIYEELDGVTHTNRDKYRGIFTDAAFLTLDFTEPRSRNGAVEQLAGSVPLSLLQNFTVELEIDNAAPSAGRITAKQTVRAPTRAPWIHKMFKTTDSFSAAGEQVLYLPNAQSGGKMKRIYLHEQTPGTTTAVELRIGNKVVYEATRAEIEFDQKRFGNVPQTGVLALDFIEDGNLSGVLDTVKTSQPELRITASAGNSYTVFYELIDPLQNA